MTQPSKPIKAIIFDLDDTLIDWSGQELHGAEIGQRHLKNIYAHLQTNGHNLPEEVHFFEHFGDVLVAMWQEAKKSWDGVALADVINRTVADCGIQLDEAGQEELLRVYNWQPIPGVRPYDDALPVLETLKKDGYKIGLVTNSMQPMWMRDTELELYGILPYLDARITSGDTGYMKPHPAIYQRILDLLAVQPAEAMFVGDRPTNDIAGANEVGLTSVLMSPHHLDYDLSGVQPDFTIRRLTELLPILSELKNGH